MAFMWCATTGPASRPGEGVEQNIAVPCVLGRPGTGTWVLQQCRHMCVTPLKEALHPQQHKLDLKLDHSAIAITIAVKGDSKCIYMYLFSNILVNKPTA